MSGVGGIGGAGGIDRVLALRAQILERNEALARAAQTGPVAGPSGATETKPTSFADTLGDALKTVNRTQSESSKLSEAYERGEEVDIAKVMLARQQASIGFEATLQVRNKILAAYKDIMSMPV
jgi:flagellar hook-basal body complex protein FliE